MKIRLLIILTFLQCLQTDLVVAKSLNIGNNEESKYLLNTMIKSRQKVENVQYHIEYIDSYNLVEFKKQIEGNNPARYKETINRILKEEKDNQKTSYQIQTIVLDDTGRTKIDLTRGLLDPSGQKIPIDSLTWSWDNHQSIVYRKKGPKSDGSAVLNNEESAGTSRQRHPWRSFTGRFLRDLEEAIKAQETIDVEELSEGTYRVIFNKKNGLKKIGIADPAKGFSCTLDETHKDGNLFVRRTAEYEEFNNGIWFPVTGEMTKFSSEGVEILRSNMKVSSIKINDPDFHEGLFHVDLPKGTSVFDRVSGFHYVVGEPMSGRMRIGAADFSLDEIAKDMLEGIVKETEQKHEEIEIFIPKVSIALKKRTLFVLDLSDRKLISAPSKPDSEKAHKYLTKIGKGDIAWDGTVVATRGASVLTTEQESKRPLTFTKGKWSRSYKLPEKVELPYSMLIVTKEKTNYLMTIRKIESGGIRVTYRKLNPDELSRYKQRPKDSQ